MPRYGIEFMIYVNAPDANQAYREITQRIEQIESNAEVDLSYESCPSSGEGWALNEDTGREELINYDVVLYQDQDDA